MDAAVGTRGARHDEHGDRERADEAGEAQGARRRAADGLMADALTAGGLAALTRSAGLTAAAAGRAVRGRGRALPASVRRRRPGSPPGGPPSRSAATTRRILRCAAIATSAPAAVTAAATAMGGGRVTLARGSVAASRTIPIRTPSTSAPGRPRIDATIAGAPSAASAPRRGRGCRPPSQGERAGRRRGS